MDRDELIRLAEEAGFQSFEDGRRDDGTTSTYLDCWVEQLEKFAEVIATAEREACATLAEEFYLQEKSALAVAAAIRVRGDI